MLSAGEINQLSAVADREGGIASVVDQLRTAKGISKRNAALTTLSPAITVTVQDWPALETFSQTLTNQDIGFDEIASNVLAGITAQRNARSAIQLGPLFWMHYLVAKART